MSDGRQRHKARAARTQITWAFWQVGWFLRTCFFMRYGILAVSFMPLLALLALSSPWGIVAGLFAVDDDLQLLLVTALQSWTIGCGFAIYRTVWINAAKRFRDYESTTAECFTSWGRYVAALTWLGLTLLVGWTCANLSDPLGDSHWGVRGGSYVYLVIFMATAVAGAFLLWAGWAARRFEWIRQEAEILPWIRLRPSSTPLPLHARIWLWFLRWLGPGYVEPISDTPHSEELARPGHGTMFLLGMLTVFAYAATLFIAGREGPENSPFSVGYFVVAVGALAILALAGDSFFFDRFRLPVPATLIFLSYCSFRLLQQDHYFETLPAKRRDQFQAAPSVDDVFAAYTRDKIPKGQHGRTLVIVTAAGGGIQADAWVIRVLTGLHERYGNRFTRSVVCVSGVSGGGLATLQYLTRYGELASVSSPPSKLKQREIIDEMNKAARENGLLPVAYGFARFDLPRLLVPGLTRAFDPLHDRGWELEQFWSRRRDLASESSIQGLSLRNLESLVRTKDLPLPIFNTTLANTGQRCLISPFTLFPEQPFSQLGATEFIRMYPNDDLTLQTAARLSASFSYVSPICRPAVRTNQVPDPSDVRFADGGYADNEGIVSAVNYLQALVNHFESDEHSSERVFDRVVVVRILAFPEEPPLGTPSTTIVPYSGWTYATAGPILLLNKVRVSSQSERGQLEFDLLKALSRIDAEPAPAESAPVRVGARPLTESRPATAAAAIGDAPQPRRASALKQATDSYLEKTRSPSIKYKAAEFAPGAAPTPPADELPPPKSFEIVDVKFVFPRMPGPDPPLSWRLTQSQQRQIDEAWDQLVADTAASPCVEPVATSSVTEGQRLLSLDDLFSEPQPPEDAPPTPVPVPNSSELRQETDRGLRRLWNRFFRGGGRRR